MWIQSDVCVWKQETKKEERLPQGSVYEEDMFRMNSSDTWHSLLHTCSSAYG